MAINFECTVDYVFIVSLCNDHSCNDVHVNVCRINFQMYYYFSLTYAF